MESAEPAMHVPFSVTQADRSRFADARTIAAATIGTALESADLMIYAFLAISLSKAFFPSSNPALSLLATFLTYSSTFVVRPLGAIVWGAYADRAGRKRAMSLILAMMGVGSLAIGIMPAYASIGIWAPIGVVAARMLQGFSVGGEQGSAVALLAERDEARRSEYLGYLVSSGGIGQMISAGAAATLAYCLPPAQIDAWGWRLCFLFGALIYPVGLYIRASTEDSEEFKRASKIDRPIMTVIRAYPLELVCATFLSSATTVTLYFSMYLPGYAVSRLGMELKSSLIITMLSGLAMAILSPLSGALADRLGCFRMVAVGAIVLVPLPWVLLSWLSHHADATHLLLIQLCLVLAYCVYAPAQVSLTANLFPTNVRASGVSLCSALSGSLVGGFALFGFAALGAMFRHPAAPSLYVVVTSCLALGALAVLAACRTSVRSQ